MTSLMANSVVPLCRLRGGACTLKRRHQEDENIALGEVMPLNTFLDEEKKKTNFCPHLLKQVSKLQLMRQKQIIIQALSLHLVSNSLLIGHFNRGDQRLDLYNMAEDGQSCTLSAEEDYFDSDTIVFIGSWGSNLLAYTIPFMDDGVAALVKINLNTMSTCKFLSWDLTVFWTHRRYIRLEGPNDSSIGFDSSVSANGKLVLVTGPSETFGSASVCKILDAETAEIIQVIDLQEFKFMYRASFHPETNWIVMICSPTLFGYSGKKAHTSEGMHQSQLICYNRTSREVVAKTTFMDVAPELLKISPNGKLIGIKRKTKGAVAILCSQSLDCLMLIEQEFSFGRDMKLLTNLMFQMFPLFSEDSKQCTVLQNKKQVLSDQRLKRFRWSGGDMWVTRVTAPERTQRAGRLGDQEYPHKRKHQDWTRLEENMYQCYPTNGANGFGQNLVQMEDLDGFELS